MSNEFTIDPPWLRPALTRWHAAVDRLPHALLVHGPAGIGKTRLATAIARDVLCETPRRERPPGGCGTCPSCLWFAQGNHPDYRQVTSEALALAAGLDADAGEEGESTEPAASRSKRAPSKEIKVEQVRALVGFMGVGTHRGGHRVVQLQPVEAMNDVAANALLKMLEEPPPMTVFVLVADQLGRIPPTILSRCQKLTVDMPAPDVAAAWLAGQGVNDPEAALAVAGGAPLQALELVADDATIALRNALVGFLSRPNRDAATALADSFAKAPVAPIVAWMQQWAADCVALKSAGRLRYHPAHSKAVETLVRPIAVQPLSDWYQRLSIARRSADHPLNPRLLFESLFLDYCDTFAPSPH